MTSVRSCCVLCKIVSAVLEHEAIAGLSAGKPSGLRGRALQSSSNQSRGSVIEEKTSDDSLDLLIKAVCTPIVSHLKCLLHFATIFNNFQIINFKR